MAPFALRPTFETLEPRDAPVILITVVTPLTLLGLGGITFESAGNPRHAVDVDVRTRGAIVSIGSGDPGDDGGGPGRR